MRTRILLAAVLLAAVLTPAAMADDMAVIDAATAGTVVIAEPYFSVSCLAEGTVTMSVSDDHGALCYERMATGEDGLFVSDAVYLPVQEGNTAYTVVIASAAGTWSFRVVRTLGYQHGLHACAGTYPFAAAAGRPSDERIMLVPVRDGIRVFPLVAGSVWQVGTVTCTVQDGALTASVRFAEGVTGDEPRVEVALRAREIAGLTDAGPGILRAADGESVDLGNAGAVAVWVGVNVSFDPAVCLNAPAEGPEDQELLWRRMVEAAD